MLLKSLEGLAQRLCRLCHQQQTAAKWHSQDSQSLPEVEKRREGGENVNN